MTYEAARELERDRKWGDADRAYERLLGDPSRDTQVRRRRIECLVRLQRWEEAAREQQLIDAALGSPAARNNRDVKRATAIHTQRGELERAFDVIEGRATYLVTEGDLVPGDHILLTAAAPKTGSTSLSVALAGALGATKVNFLTTPPTDRGWGLVSARALETLRGFSVVNHCHLSPAPENLKVIEERPWVRVAVHLRNPFESIESTIDLVVRQRSPSMLSGSGLSASSSVGELREWVLDVYSFRLRDWMTDWVRLVDGQHPSVVGLSTLDEVKADGQDKVSRRLLRGIGNARILATATEPQRRGVRLSGDERIRLTAEERRLILQIFPENMMQRFGWAS